MNPDPAEEGFDISPQGQTLTLSGAPSGIWSGACKFLLRFGGCQFSGLGPDCQHVPRRRQIEVARPLRMKPRLRCRGCQFFYPEPLELVIQRLDWMAKNGLNYVIFTPRHDDPAGAGAAAGGAIHRRDNLLAQGRRTAEVGSTRPHGGGGRQASRGRRPAVAGRRAVRGRARLPQELAGAGMGIGGHARTLAAAQRPDRAFQPRTGRTLANSPSPRCGVLFTPGRRRTWLPASISTPPAPSARPRKSPERFRRRGGWLHPACPIMARSRPVRGGLGWDGTCGPHLARFECSPPFW